MLLNVHYDKISKDEKCLIKLLIKLTTSLIKSLGSKDIFATPNVASLPASAL